MTTHCVCTRRDNHIGDGGVAALSALLGEGVAEAVGAGSGRGGEEEGVEGVEGGQCPLLEDLHLGYNDVGPAGALL